MQFLEKEGGGGDGRRGDGVGDGSGSAGARGWDRSGGARSPGDPRGRDIREGGRGGLDLGGAGGGERDYGEILYLLQIVVFSKKKYYI